METVIVLMGAVSFALVALRTEYHLYQERLGRISDDVQYAYWRDQMMS